MSVLVWLMVLVLAFFVYESAKELIVKYSDPFAVVLITLTSIVIVFAISIFSVKTFNK